MRSRAAYRVDLWALPGAGRRRAPACIAAPLVAMACLFLTTTAADAATFFDASVRHMRRAVTAQSDGSHLARLFALRQLCDATLEPLFRRIAQHEPWPVQVHAILGLAEIAVTDTGSHIDPWLVRQVDTSAQQMLIASALDMGLAGREQIQELLAWDELDSQSRLMLIGELMLDGVAAADTVDRSSVAKLAGSSHREIAGMASMLLAQLGDAAPFSAHADQLATLPNRDRNRHLLWMLEIVRQFELTVMEDWVRQTIETPGVDRDVKYWGVYTVLTLDAREGAALWERHLGSDPGYGQQVRYGMLALAAGKEVPVRVYDRLDSKEALVRRMVDVGRAMSEGRNLMGPLIALIDLGHAKTATWAMQTLEELPPAESGPVYQHIIENFEREQDGQAERNAAAIEATTNLFEADPNAVLGRLQAVPDDSVSQEVILLGLFETRSAAAGRAAAGLRRIGAGRADSLALLLMARHGEPLSDDDIRSLGRIAAGGGRVSIGLQAQAAWLYLKRSGEIDRALLAIFDEDS